MLGLNSDFWFLLWHILRAGLCSLGPRWGVLSPSSRSTADTPPALPHELSEQQNLMANLGKPVWGGNSTPGNTQTDSSTVARVLRARRLPRAPSSFPY